MRIHQQKFGETIDGKEVTLFTLANPKGITVNITNYGGIITSILMPDRLGNYDDVVLGFKRFEDYIDESYLSSYPYLGAICGRFANRISHGRFMVDGVEYHLGQNSGSNHIHGGLEGFDKKLWNFKILEYPQELALKLSYFSPDGEENYPGNLKVDIIYRLNKRNELIIEYHAVSDKSTPVNLTNHTYFNLSGGKNNVLKHKLELESEEYTKTDITSIPMGTYDSVSETPLDFRGGELIGKRIAQFDDGYDHNYIIKGNVGMLRKAAVLSENESGRRVEILTTQPGIQVYSGYYLPNINGRPGRYSGIALETQHFPDSPNHPGFPDTILKPGEIFKELTVYRFNSDNNKGGCCI